MASVRKWSNVAVNMESAISAPTTITAISKAAEGIVSAAGHTFVNGDYVLISAQGMSQVDNRVYRVIGVVATTSFKLEAVSGGVGIDTTLFDTFTSGNAKKITFGTSITTVAEVSSQGGSFSYIDTTTIHINQKTQIPGLPEALAYEMTHLWDITDAGQQALKTASDAQAQKAFKFVFGVGGPIMVFVGYVGYTGAPGGTAQDKITSPCTVTAFGSPVFYAA